MAAGHDVLFTWPHPEPNEVILSGTFNQWSRTQRLTKGPDGFSGSATVPWGEKTAYKFIVDGEWMVHEDQPTEPDGDGNINNVYTAPPNPVAPPVVPAQVLTTDDDFLTAAAPKGREGMGIVPPNGKPADQAHTRTSSLPQLVSDLADTVAARAGTSSAFEYVASGLGAAIQGVVGVDPINADQIAIPTPLPTGATVTEFEVPKDTAFLTADSIAPAPAPASTGSEVKLGPPVENAHEKAPFIPVTIIPVNTAENRPVPNVPASESAGTEIPLFPAMTNVEPEDKPSTHRIVSADKPAPLVGDIGAGPTDAVTGEPLVENEELGPEETEPKPKGGDEHAPEPSEMPAKAEAESTSKAPAEESGELPKLSEGAAMEDESVSKAGPAPPAEESEELPKVKSPVEGPPKSTIGALAQSALEAATQPGVETPPKSSTTETPSKTPTETPPKPPPMNTPQATTPNSDLNPASVLAEIQTPAAAAGLRAAEVTPPFDTPVVTSPETPTTVPAAEPSAEKEKGEDEGVEGTEETGLPPTMAPNVKVVAETKVEAPASISEAEKPRINGKTEAAPAPEEKRPETPTTPKKAFPSAESPSASPSTSKAGTAASRKKKTSIYGKIKHLFDHDKEKEKEKAKAKK